jgi:hypothetical protein
LIFSPGEGGGEYFPIFSKPLHTRWKPNTPDRMQKFCITSTIYLERRLSCQKWQMGLVQRNLSTTAIISATITTSA